MTSPAPTFEPKSEALERLRDVLWRPRARVYAAPDVYDWLLRAKQPASMRRAPLIPAGVVLIRSQYLSPGTIVGLAPLPSLPAPDPTEEG